MPLTPIATYNANATQAATSPLTSSVTTAVGDTLVCVALCDGASRLLATPTGGTNLTWTLQTSSVSVTSYGNLYIWTATATTAETFTCSVASTAGTASWQFFVSRWSGVTSIGAKGNAHAAGAPTLSITSTGTNSALVVGNVDYNGGDGSTRTWLTSAGAVTQINYSYTAGTGTQYGAYYGNVGAPGVETVGLSAPTGQAYTIGAVELVGAPSTTGTLPAAGAGTAALAFTPTTTGTFTSAGGGAAALDGSLTQSRGFTAAATSTATVAGPVGIAGTLSAPTGVGAATLGAAVTHPATLTAAGVGAAAVTGGSALTSLGVGSATVGGSGSTGGALTAAATGGAVLVGFRGQFASLTAAGAGSAALTAVVVRSSPLTAAGAGSATVTGFRGKTATLTAAGYGTTTLLGIAMPPPLHVPVAATLSPILGTATLTPGGYAATVTPLLGTATLQII